MIGKRIIRLKFNSCAPYDVPCDFVDKSAYQPLWGFAALKLDHSRAAQIRARAYAKTCIVCGSEMAVEYDQRSNDDFGSHIVYEACCACGCWRRNLSATDHSGFVLPSIREFDGRIEEPSLSHLANEISLSPASLYSMDPRQFELFVGSILADFYDCEVHHVGRTGDDGIDLMAIVKDEPLLIQVKRRSAPDATEGVNTVKLLFASAFARQSDHGMVVTTATRFTKQAQKWTRSPRFVDVRFDLQLIDFGSLMSMVDCVARSSAPPPWQAHMRRDRPRPNFSEGGWVHQPYKTHDILTHIRAGNCTVIFIDHKDFENCTVFSGDTALMNPLRDAAKGRAELLRLQGKALLSDHPPWKCTHRHLDTDLESELGVPFSLADSVASRWCCCYPNLVIDRTP